jgi:hypothetical protein
MGFQGDANIDVNFNYNYLVIQTTMKMRDAKAKQDWWEYWVHFEFAIQLVLSYLEPAVAKEIQLDFDEMDKKIQALGVACKAGQIAEKTKEIQLNELRREFSDRHRYYVLKALNKIGIVKVAEDGIVDFDSTDLKTMATVIRTDRDKDQILANPTPMRASQLDMTLVVDPVSKKVYRMGTDDYKAYVQSKIYTKNTEAKAVPSEVPSAEELAEIEKADPASVQEPQPVVDAPQSAAQPVVIPPDMPDAPDIENELPSSGFRLSIGYPKDKNAKGDIWDESTAEPKEDDFDSETEKEE